MTEAERAEAAAGWDAMAMQHLLAARRLWRFGRINQAVAAECNAANATRRARALRAV